MKTARIIRSIGAGVTLALLITGCAKSETSSLPTPKNAIDFSPLVTRAAVTSLGEGDSFAVWGWYGSPSVNVFDGTTVTNIQNVWSYDGTRYWVPGQEYTFYAAYPAGEGHWSNDGIYSITDFDCSATGANVVDLMTSPPVKGNGDNSQQVIFTFNHELSRLKFVIKTSETEGAIIKDIKLFGVSTQGSLTKSFKNGGSTIWSNLHVVASDNTPYSENGPIILESDKNYELFEGDIMLPPHSSLDEARLSLSYYDNWENEENTRSVELQLVNGTGGITSWTAGNSYEYTVNIPATNDIKLTVAIIDWDEQDTSVSWTSGN